MGCRVGNRAGVVERGEGCLWSGVVVRRRGTAMFGVASEVGVWRLSLIFLGCAMLWRDGFERCMCCHNRCTLRGCKCSPLRKDHGVRFSSFLPAG